MKENTINSNLYDKYVELINNNELVLKCDKIWFYNENTLAISIENNGVKLAIDIQNYDDCIISSFFGRNEISQKVAESIINKNQIEFLSFKNNRYILSNKIDLISLVSLIYDYILNYNKTKVAVVIATPVHSNSGMYSVDMAAIDFFSSINVDFTIFCTQLSGELYKGVDVQLLKNINQIKHYTHLIYWGDFLNNPIYGLNGYSKRDVFLQNSVDIKEARDKWLDLFTLRNTNISGIMVGAFGGNFQFLFENLGVLGKKSILDVINNFDLIMPRDYYSNLNIANSIGRENRNKINKIKLGMDCAFLYPKKKQYSKKQIFSGYFFRSKIPEIDVILKSIADDYQLEFHNENRWLNLPVNSNRHYVFEEMKRIQQESKFIISDTYHYIINSINVGTIPIGIGRKESNQKGTLGDYKKKTLFESINLEELYIEIDDDASKEVIKNHIINKISYITNNYDEFQAKVDFINNYLVENFKRNIITFLN